MENEIENYDGSMRSDFEGTPQRSTGRNWKKVAWLDGTN
jgi:hypothetical protein